MKLNSGGQIRSKHAECGGGWGGTTPWSEPPVQCLLNRKNSNVAEI